MLRRPGLLSLCPLLLSLGAAVGCSGDDRGTSTGPIIEGDGDGDQPGDGDGDGDGDQPGDGDGDGDGDGPSGVGCDKMDIVFVIDNSGSMDEEQELLKSSFPKMIDVLSKYRGGVLDYRVAVTTTAFPLFGGAPVDGEQGKFIEPKGQPNPWLESSDANLAADFSALADVGTDGSGFEQPLRAAQWSVKERLADKTNGMFLRENSLLAFVLITDEEDGSLQGLGVDLPVGDVIKTFDQVTGDRSRWASWVIAGETDCTSALGDATEAARLKDFVKQTGKNATFSSICAGNLDKGLEDALNTFTSACDNIVLL
jgi:hypothetical protein